MEIREELLEIELCAIEELECKIAPYTDDGLTLS